MYLGFALTHGFALRLAASAARSTERIGVNAASDKNRLCQRARCKRCGYVVSRDYAKNTATNCGTTRVKHLRRRNQAFTRLNRVIPPLSMTRAYFHSPVGAYRVHHYTIRPDPPSECTFIRFVVMPFCGPYGATGARETAQASSQVMARTRAPQIARRDNGKGRTRPGSALLMGASSLCSTFREGRPSAMVRASC